MQVTVNLILRIIGLCRQPGGRSLRRLVILLGFALFVLGATFEVVLAYQLPAVLRVTHSLEILVDSLVYAWLLITLLVPRMDHRAMGVIG